MDSEAYPAIVLLLLLAAGVGWLAVAIVRFNLERRAARAIADTLSDADAEQIFEWIEQIGEAPNPGYIGIIRDKRRGGPLSLVLPRVAGDFPWSQHPIRVTAGERGATPPVTFELGSKGVESATESSGVRWLAVPVTRTGKQKSPRNVFATSRYIKLSAPLKKRLELLHPKNSPALLNYLLSSNGSIEPPEPFDQLRCGLPAAWIQTPRFHKCRQCRRPLTLILQVPGGLLNSRLAEGTFYFLGCPSHPTEIAIDQDWG